MSLRKSLSAALAVFLLQIGSVHAALFNFEFTGTVDIAPAGNLFSLNVSDTITASGIFDDTVLTGGSGSIQFGDSAPASNTISIVVGSGLFEETDPLFGTATLVLGSSTPFEIDSFSIDSQNTAGESFRSAVFGNPPSLEFFATDLTFNTIDGDWNTNSFTTSPVPVPAAVWLFGSGLLALFGFARKKLL